MRRDVGKWGKFISLMVKVIIDLDKFYNYFHNNKVPSFFFWNSFLSDNKYKKFVPESDP